MTEPDDPNTLRISRDAIGILLEYTGRRPSNSTVTVGEDTVTVLMGDALTQQERNLVETGNVETVMSLRHTIQAAMGDALVAMVEGHTGRKVIAFMSQNHLDPDLAVEVFVLEPAAAAAA